MSGFPPGTFDFADRIAAQNVEQALRDARARQLANQVSPRRRAAMTLLSNALVSMGSRLSRWGERLRQRYASETAVRSQEHLDSLAIR